MSDVLERHFWEAINAGDQAFLVRAPQKEHENFVQTMTIQAKRKVATKDEYKVITWMPGEGFSNGVEAPTLFAALGILFAAERSASFSDAHSVMVFKWPAAELTNAPATRARLCDAIAGELFNTQKRHWPAVFVMHSSETLPKAVLDHLIEIPWELPNETYFAAETVPAMERSLQQAQLGAVPLERRELVKRPCTPELRSQISRNLRGLDALNARMILARAVVRCGSFYGKASDGATLHDVVRELKDGVLRTSAALEPVPASEIPDIDELVGMPDLIAWTRDRSLAYTAKARRYKVAPPRFVILAGVTGAGKSMAFRAVSHITGKKPYVLNLTRCMDRWVGSSENNVREAFASAFALQESFCLEEIDKMMAGTQGSGDTDGGVRRSVLGETLRFIDKLISAPDNETLLVATCNRLGDLAPELLRRADKIWGVDLPDDEERWQILKVHCRRLGIDPEGYESAKDEILPAMSDFVGYDVVKGLADAHASSLNNPETGEPRHSPNFTCGRPTPDQLIAAFKSRKPVIAQDPEGVKAQIELVRSKCDPVNAKKTNRGTETAPRGRRNLNVGSRRDD